MDHIYGIKAKVKYFSWYSKKIYALKLFSPEICKHASPGQFVMVRDDNWQLTPFLNRPMSIANVDKNTNIFELQILVTGKGTALLSNIDIGSVLQVIGPLGNTFSTPQPNEKIALIAGGIGIAPLIYYHSSFKSNKTDFTFFYGAANDKELIAQKFLPDKIRISTDDGSKGFEGFVTKDFENYLLEHSIDKILACGPNLMLKAVQKIADIKNINCELSIETIMACGYGICQGCIVKKQNKDNEYLLTCIDGPVFNSKNIDLEF